MAAAERSSLWKRALQALVSLAIVVGIFVGVMPLIADYGDVFETIGAMTGLELSSLLLIGLWNLVTYWFVLTAALPGLRFREAAVAGRSDCRPAAAGLHESLSARRLPGTDPGPGP